MNTVWILPPKSQNRMSKDHHKLWRLHGEIWDQKDTRSEGNTCLPLWSMYITNLPLFTGCLGWIHAYPNDISCQSSWALHNCIPKSSQYQWTRRNRGEHFSNFLQVIQHNTYLVGIPTGSASSETEIQFSYCSRWFTPSQNCIRSLIVGLHAQIRIVLTYHKYISFPYNITSLPWLTP